MSKLLANQIANFGDDAPIEIKEGLNIPAGKPIQAAGVVGNSGQVLTSTGSTIQWVTPFSGDYSDLIGRPTIPAAQVQVNWNASSGLSSILNKPIVPAQPSVVLNAAGSSALAYNQSNGEFTFTPPDLSGYAANTNVSNWDTAYGWGDHSTAGYLVATASDKSNWNAAHAWGDHASAGYITSYTETSTFQNVIDRGNTSTSPVYISNKLYFSNAFGTLTDLQAVSATTYHGMFAHAHDTGHGYFAHAGAWTQLIDEASSIDELGDVDTTTVSPSDGYVLKWEASSSSWKPAPDLVGTSNAGITLQDLSVNNVAASSAPALSYSNTTGVFTYTPYDPSTYAETDPVFSASAVANVQATDIANWDAAYGWGDHASGGYAPDTNVANWNTAYGWGDHGVAGYLTSYSETDTLDSVVGRGATTSVKIIANGGVRADVLGVGGGIGNGDVQLQHNDTSNVSTLGHYNVNGSFEITSVSKINLKPGSDSGNSVDIYHNIDGSTEELRIQTTDTGATISGALTAGGLTYPTTNGTSGDVLTSDGAGNVTWAAPTGGGGGGSGANVTISDTIPAGTPSAGDLWWESDSGRLKVYYTDVDSSQWIDASPPLTQDRIASSSAPSSATDTGTPGDIRYDSGYVYICISNNTWKRAALATW